MREKLNESQSAQVALILVLALIAVVLFMKPFGGGEEKESESSSGATVTATESGTTENAGAEVGEGAIASISTGGIPNSVPAPPPPKAYSDAYEANDTVVLLIVHDGGIDDRRVQASSEALEAMPRVALFEVPVKQLPRYAAITVGLEISRVPALVVVRPRRLSGGVPQASVDYGFQTRKTAEQAVRDAAYKGPEATYHPN